MLQDLSICMNLITVKGNFFTLFSPKVKESSRKHFSLDRHCIVSIPPTSYLMNAVILSKSKPPAVFPEFNLFKIFGLVFEGFFKCLKEIIE